MVYDICYAERIIPRLCLVVLYDSAKQDIKTWHGHCNNGTTLKFERIKTNIVFFIFIYILKNLLITIHEKKKTRIND